MKRNGLSSALQTVIANALHVKGELKTELFIRYFRQDTGLNRIRDLYQTGSYNTALTRLISYIQSRKHILHLTCCMLDGGFVNNCINDYKGYKNSCAIRSERQLASLLGAFPPTGKKEEKKILLRLVQRAQKTKSFLLLIDKDTESRILFRELIHEFDAWLYSGCAAGKENLRCMMMDWRTNLLHEKGYRDLDAYFLTQQKAPGTAKRELNTKIIKVVHMLSGQGYLQTFAPLRKKEIFNQAYVYVASAKRPGGAGTRTIVSYGVSFDSRELAMIKCLSELLERISFQWDNRILPKTVSSATLQKEGYFTEYIGRKNMGKTSFGCVEGADIVSEKKVFIPAQFIYTNYLEAHHENVISPFTGMGSGVAAGDNRYAVLLNALYELIERDALVTGCLNNSDPYVMSPDSLADSRLKQVVCFLERRGFSHRVFDITNDLEVPTYLSLITKNGEMSFAAGGVKSHHNPSVALFGAVEESYLEWVLKQKELDRRGFGGKTTLSLSPAPILTYDRFRAPHRNTLPMKKAPLYSAYAMTEKEALGKIIQKLRGKKHRILSVDITPSWLTGAYKVYRVFVPSLQPLFFTAREKWINKKRIHDAGEYFRKQKKD